MSAGFAGMSECVTIDTCSEPPDPWVAVGVADVIQAVNTSLRISTRAGATLATVSLSSFFGEPVGQVVDTDPRVLWDSVHGRWLASAASFDCTAGHLYLAVSSSADPMGAWSTYQFDYPGVFPDYPALAASSDKVVLSANEYSIVPSGGSCDADASAYSGASLLVADWSDLMVAGAATYSTTGADPTLFTWRPATALSPTATLPAVVKFSRNGDVGYATISGTNAAANVTVSAVTDLTSSGIVTGFSHPPIPHGGTSFDGNTVDDRPTNAIWQNGRLWFVSTYPCDPAGNSVLQDCVRATSLATGSTTPTLAQDFLAGYPSYDFFHGGIGLSLDGSLYLVFSVASASTWISSYATVQLPDDPANTYRPLALVAAGAATYSGTRWGDYVGIAQDPMTPSAVWQADEYPNATGSWSTHVSMLGHADAPGGPTAVAAVPGNASAVVSWSAPSSDGGAPVIGYTVTSVEDATKTCATSGGLTCTVTGLANGSPYTFTVTATNAIGTGPASAPSAPVTPAAPPPPPIPPTASITALPGLLTTNAVPVRWRATPGTSALSSYDVRYRRAAWNGGFGGYATWLSGTGAPAGTFYGIVGSTYCFSARARDVQGLVSGWTGETCTAVPLDDRSLARYGSWAAGTGSAYYRSTFARSYAYGSRLIRTGVVARQVALLAMTCRTCGSVRVYWGSSLLRTVSLYSSTTQYRRIIAITTFTSARSGTLTIRVSSSGRAVMIDGVVIRR